MGVCTPYEHTLVKFHSHVGGSVSAEYSAVLIEDSIFPGEVAHSGVTQREGIRREERVHLSLQKIV